MFIKEKMKKQDIKIIKGKRYIEYKEPVVFKSIHYAFLFGILWLFIDKFFDGWWNLISVFLVFFLVFIAQRMYNKEIARVKEDERIKFKYERRLKKEWKKH